MTKPEKIVNKELQQDIVAHCEELKRAYSARNKMFDDMANAYLVKWEEEETVKGKFENVKITKSPTARNKLLGAKRLLTATDPAWNIPAQVNDVEAERRADSLRKMSETIWKMNGDITGRPLHYEIVLSMLLFSECHVIVTRTSDLVTWSKDSNKAAKARFEEIARQTPYIFEVTDPRTGYPEIGTYGLNSFYREVDTTTGNLMDEFGKQVIVNITKSESRITPVVCGTYWDYENRLIFIKGYDTPILFEEHGLPFIPVSVNIGEGSRILSTDEKEQREPFLYTFIESGLYSRQNLMLTLMATLAFDIGANPIFKMKVKDKRAPLRRDFSVPGGLWLYEEGEDIDPLSKIVIDPSVMQLWEIAGAAATESTIYDQALGEPLGSNAPFSMVALLHQAGRLPLITYQRMASRTCADVMKLAIRWMKNDAKKYKAGYINDVAELASADIPKDFVIEASLEISLPQDRLNDARIAQALKQGDDPMVSDSWVLEEILGVKSGRDMKKDVLKEKAWKMITTQHFSELLVKIRENMVKALTPQVEKQVLPQKPLGMGKGGTSPLSAEGMPVEPMMEPQSMAGSEEMSI
jgi:hypothetical protein